MSCAFEDRDEEGCCAFFLQGESERTAASARLVDFRSPADFTEHVAAAEGDLAQHALEWLKETAAAAADALDEFMGGHLKAAVTCHEDPSP